MPGKFIKICGLTNYADAKAAFEAGADYLGFILVPGARRAIEKAEFDRIDFGKKVGVFLNAPIDYVLSFKLDVIQLHGMESEEYISELRSKSSREIWKALPVVDKASFEFAKNNYKGLTLLIDSEKGGRPCDRVLSGELSKIRPTILAGGLTPENVGGAIALGEPIGVDVAGGVESESDPRKKDIEKIKAFIKEARKNL
jgi:phosphoribosylanthranilate isomerase